MRRYGLSALLLGAFLLVAGPARAEVQGSSPSAFLLRGEVTTSASADEVWRDLAHPERWWNPEHTYSGDARRLRLDLRANGCWCERWGEGQSVEHARVVLVMEREGVRTLRLLGGLGPLQEMGVSGVLTFTVSPREAGAKVEASYRVAGDSGLALDQIAPLVDQVIFEQLDRLARYADTGSPQ